MAMLSVDTTAGRYSAGGVWVKGAIDSGDLGYGAEVTLAGGGGRVCVCMCVMCVCVCVRASRVGESNVGRLL
ncbi:hypothetical protein B0A54_09891 [Friedmanniomyces endolithicus]|uniref:Uncharacterized protein n=1 Tax=Friedmanniomyces endolithicus TaxID=329885 RepID=A0A4U0UTK1_9PEZI|nr:hypothetical protein B0A54_09891 [Friedmanniomyces endolithicus]